MTTKNRDIPKNLKYSATSQVIRHSIANTGIGTKKGWNVSDMAVAMLRAFGEISPSNTCVGSLSSIPCGDDPMG